MLRVTESNLSSRRFLLLQGPQSRFFYCLSQALIKEGASVFKVNFCGGDVFLWGVQNSLLYRQDVYHWPAWIGQVFRKYQITDLCLYGDWRPLHWEAVRLAKLLSIRVWVYEEGYLRNGYSTLEEFGVNGRSLLPKTAHRIHEMAQGLREVEPIETINDIRDKVYGAIRHHVGNVLLWPFFHHYKTHRPTNIAFELVGILPRYLTRHKRHRESEQKLEAFYKDDSPYYFFPLQLNSDSQIQLYSPYVRLQEALASIMTSFALHAPSDSRLLIKNHPLDNGLLDYAAFIRSFATELGLLDRVTFVEDGSTAKMIQSCRGVVLVNSTVGLMALEAGKPVYCLGQSVYNIQGLTQSLPLDSLDNFWNHPVTPNSQLYQDFKLVLQNQALVRGNFYSFKGIEIAVSDSLLRFKEPRRHDYDITKG